MLLLPPVAGFVQSYEVIEALHLADVNLAAVEFLVETNAAFPRFLRGYVIIDDILSNKASNVPDVHLPNLLIGNNGPVGLDVFQKAQADVQPNITFEVTILIGDA